MLSRFREIFITLLRVLILTLLFNVIAIIILVIFQSSSEEFYVNIGFPYPFFYFNEAHGLHGANLDHFILDGVVWFVISTPIVMVYNRMAGKEKSEYQKSEVID